MKYILNFLLFTLLFAQVSFSRNYAYIYIEGDKQTPFYVKVEGQMTPRLGKNYCILSNLDAGVTNIEVLFQQNIFPAQKFAINIPEGGNRGFLLQKVNDRQFALYDLQQGTYLVAGNKPEDDHLPVAVQKGDAPGVVASRPIPSGESVDEIPAFTTEVKKKKDKSLKVKKEEPSKEEVQEKERRFIDDIELNRGGQPVAGAKDVPPVLPDFDVTPLAKAKNRKKRTDENLPALREEGEETKNVRTKPEEEEVTTSPTTNSGIVCNSPLSSEEFEEFALKILDKADDDARIKVLVKSKGRKCFTTEQVRIIANNLVTQSGRYDVAKLLYPQTSDKENYSKLESLFKTNFLRNKFKEIISGQ